MIVPAGNQGYREIPEGVRRGLNFVYADEYSDLIDQLLVRRPDPKRSENQVDPTRRLRRKRTKAE